LACEQEAIRIMVSVEPKFLGGDAKKIIPQGKPRPIAANIRDVTTSGMAIAIDGQ
jgi:hypothetical protein